MEPARGYVPQETTIVQRPTVARPVEHFDHRLTDKEVPTGTGAEEVEKPRDIKNLTLRPQRDAEKTTEFVSVSDSEQKVVLTTLVRET